MNDLGIRGLTLTGNKRVVNANSPSENKGYPVDTMLVGDVLVILGMKRGSGHRYADSISGRRGVLFRARTRENGVLIVRVA